MPALPSRPSTTIARRCAASCTDRTLHRYCQAFTPSASTNRGQSLRTPTALQRTLFAVVTRRVSRSGGGRLTERIPAIPPRLRERVLMLRVFGRLPVSGVTRCSEAGVRKASGEETAGGVCAGSGVGLWRFSLCMPRSLDFERGSRPSNHRGVGFGRRVQDRSGGLVVSDLRFGDRRRD